MPASASSPADVVNMALARMGYRRRVANLYDGSEAASKALDLYAQTRDDMLRDGEWDFCHRETVASLLKTGPDNYFDTSWDPATMPPRPWRYEYTYPTDCLKVRQVKGQPGFVFNPSPTPTLWSVLNDNGYSPPRRVIVANVPDAVLVYAGQVTDPTQWPADFVDALAAMLAQRLKPSLVGQISQPDMVDTSTALASAAGEQG